LLQLDPEEKRVKSAPLILAGVLLALVVSPPALTEEKEPLFEIVVLGTHHAPGMFQGETYTPGHIRATLELAKPDVVAVESHPDWFAAGRYHVVTYEAQGVAVPYARERGLPVYGVDHKDIEDWDRRAEQTAIREATALRAALESGSRLSPQWFAGPARGGPAIDWEHINSEEYGRSRYRGKSPDDEDFAAPRDRGIARNCVEMMRKHPGKRLAVVIGAHHKPYLQILLAKRGDVRLLELGEDVPFPTRKQVDAAWTSTDLLAVLAHQLDFGGGPLAAADVDLPRLKTLLGMLEKKKERPDAARYYRARILALEGKPKEAERLLDRLRSSKAEPYPFPMRNWRMRYSLSDAVEIERARLLLARDEVKAAAKLLRPVAEALDARLAELERTHSPETRRVLALKDPGFEAGERAGDIFAGWDTYVPTGHGSIRFMGDGKTKVEGRRSLRIEVVEANSRRYGFVVRQAAQIAPPLFREKSLTFALSIKGDRVNSATLEIGPPWYGRRTEPFATKTVDLSSGRWTRAEVSCPLPPRGDFYVKVKFDGQAGARLWLDDGTPIQIEYETVPSEWKYLALAARYPRWLLTATEPAASAAGLKDPGFEAGQSAGPLAGWFCGDDRAGLVRATPDETMKAEGEWSLRAEVLRVREVGGSSISQLVPVAAEKQMEFSVTLRSDSDETIVLEVYEFASETRAVHLARQDVVLKPGAWSRHSIRFRTSAGRERAAIHVYLPTRKGAKVWLDDARLAPAK